MAKKKPQPSAEDFEEKQLEEKVKKMLDPREPDEDAATSFEVIKDDDAKGKVAPDELPKKIEIKENGEPVKTAPPLDDEKSSVETTEEELQQPDETEKADEQEEPEADVQESDDTSEEVSDTQPENQPDEAEKPEEVDTPNTEDDNESDTEDKSLDAAVNEIVAQESDEVLEHEDKEIEKAFDDKKPSLASRIKSFFATWWHNKKARWITLIGLFLALIAAGAIPTSRYFILNTAGVRSSASIKVIDDSTLQPLRNVKVTINGQSGLTDADGVAKVYDIKLGRTKMLINKRAFADSEKTITIGWGSNPLSQEQLKPVGAQYSFEVTDFVSGKPIEKVEAVKGDASAFSDADGKIKLTLDMPEDEFEVQLVKDEHRTETLKINADDKTVQKVQMVPAKKHVYISKRSGKYDVYAAYADGKDEQLVLEGTGSERDDITLAPHPTRDIVALVSTRNNKRNKDGFLLSELTIIDLNDTKKVVNVAESERVQIIGWANQRLVYVQIAEGTSAANPERHRLKTYNLDEGTDAELASSNYFNDVMIAKDIILFAPSSAYAKTPTALYRINPDGSDKQIVHAEEVWSLFRTGHDKVTFTTGKDWYDFNIDDRFEQKLSGQPSTLKSRIYVDNPDKSLSLWVDQRDGKGTLLATTIENGEDKVLIERSGLKLPVYWLNNSTVVFRVSTDQETAHYVLSVDGGEARKMTDVTDTSGIDRWYYY